MIIKFKIFEQQSDINAKPFDPYGEENWSDDNEYSFKKDQHEKLDIIKEYLPSSYLSAAGRNPDFPEIRCSTEEFYNLENDDKILVFAGNAYHDLYPKDTREGLKIIIDNLIGLGAKKIECGNLMLHGNVIHTDTLYFSGIPIEFNKSLRDEDIFEMEPDELNFSWNTEEWKAWWD